MTPREELDLLRKQKRLAELEAKAGGSPLSQPETSTDGLKTLGNALSATFRVTRALGVAGQRTLENAPKASQLEGFVESVPFLGPVAKGVRLAKGALDPNTLERAAEATKPGFQPQEGERIGALLGEAAPLAPLGLVAGAAGAGLSAGSEKLASTGDLSEAGKEAAIVGGTALATGGLLKGAGAAAKKLAVKAAQKSFGFTSAMIKRLGREKVQDIASTLVEEGVVDPLGRRGATLERIDGVLQARGKEIGEILDSSNAVYNSSDVAGKVKSALLPKNKGPLFKKQEAIANEIAETVRQSSGSQVFTPLRTLHELRSAVAQRAKFNSLTDSETSDMYNKAYGVLSDEIKAVVEKTGGKPALERYLKANKVFSAASEADVALGNRVAQAEAAEPGVTLGVGSFLKDTATATPGAVSKLSSKFKGLRKVRGETSGLIGSLTRSREEK